MPESTRLTPTGPVSKTGGQSLSSGGLSDTATSEGSGSGATGPLSDEAHDLLARADELERRLLDLAGTLRDLESEASGKPKRLLKTFRERAENLADDLSGIQAEIKERGAVESLIGLVSDYQDIAQGISARAQSVRSVIESAVDEALPDAEDPATPGGETGETASQVGSGGTAAALMFFGGAALTLWLARQESSGSSSGEDTSGGSSGSSGDSPGDVAPAGGALIGQF